jgi:hypothetical protein
MHKGLAVLFKDSINVIVNLIIQITLNFIYNLVLRKQTESYVSGKTCMSGIGTKLIKWRNYK